MAKYLADKTGGVFVGIVEEFIPFSAVEIDAARKLAEAIDPNNIQEVSVHSPAVKFAKFNSEIPPYPLKEQKFYQCDFFHVPFPGIDASSIVLKNCRIEHCEITNSNLKFSDFTESEFQITGIASSFDFSDFSGAIFRDSNLEGCSIQESYFYNTKLLNSEFVHSEFVASIFLHSYFEKLDMSKSNLAYTEFEQVNFENVIFPYWGTLHITKGLHEIISGQKTWFATPDGIHRVRSDQYIEELSSLAPFFYHKRDFLALANVYILAGENAKAYDAIMNGVKDACMYGRLKVLRHLCRMASLNSFFSRTQMRKLYELIESALSNTTLTPMQYNNYFLELDLAKRRLIDCPFDLDTINITVQTVIPSSGYQKLSAALKMIDTLVLATAPTAVSHTEVRHNSPIEIVVQVSGVLGQLLLLFAMLEFIFDKSTTYIERVQNIILNAKKIKKNDIDQEEIQQLQRQITEIKNTIRTLEQSPQMDSILVLPGTEDFRGISYTLSTKHRLPEELRAYSAVK